MGMAYDATRAQVVLFGGRYFSGVLDDTWNWDGTDWTQRDPAHAPSGREEMGMAFDAARSQVVLFGGYGVPSTVLGDTWTWDGTDWALPFPASIALIPSSGPPGTVVQVQGSGFGALEKVLLTFIDSTVGNTFLGATKTDGVGAFTLQLTIPDSATVGKQKVAAKGKGSGQRAKKAFIVT